MTDFKPKLGLLPPIPGRPVLMLRPTVAVLPAPPPEVHNLEKIEDPDMLGNNKYGDCVAVAIENDRRASRAAMGLPLNKMTAAQVVANYFKMTGGPDSGLVEQLALEWAHRNGWGTDKLLCFARVNIALTPIRQTVAEFCSGVFGVEIDASETYPSSLWNADNSAYQGGHGVATGTYDQTYTVVRTWGYDARMTSSFVSKKVGEFYVLVWDFQWNALTYERQTQLVADYEALTGKTWTGPAPIPPVNPPTPPRSAVNITAIQPVRLLDTRAGNGLSGKFTAHVPRSVVIAGRGGIPANAVIVTGNLTVCNAAAKGNVAVGPDPIANPSTSTLNFKAGDELANGFTSALHSDGTLALVLGDGTTADLIIDITAYFTP
jgi:hypothetical protein